MRVLFTRMGHPPVYKVSAFAARVSRDKLHALWYKAKSLVKSVYYKNSDSVARNLPFSEGKHGHGGKIRSP